MVAVTRALLQQGAPSPNAQSPVQRCRELAGINVGGWIVLGLLMGFCCGVIATVLFQCYRRRKEESYLRKAPPAPRTPPMALPQQPSAADVGTPTVRDHRQSHLRAPAGHELRAQKHYGPLTKSLTAGQGSLVAGNEGMRSSPRFPEAGAMDTNSRGFSDQRPLPDVHGQQLLVAQGPLTSSYPAPSRQVSHLSAMSHGDQGHGAQQLQPLDHAYFGSGVHVPPPIPASSPDSSEPDYHLSHQQQVPTSVVYSGMPECLPSPTAEVPSETYPAPLTAPRPISRNAGPQQATVGERMPSVSSLGERTASQATAATASSMRAASGAVEVDDAYEEHELDDDWKKLLGDVDIRLLAQNHRAMNARERSVAIKKLLIATGTRGVDFAMNAALHEVLHFRKFHEQ